MAENKENSIYQRINAIKKEICNTQIKRSGKNTYANYEYMELGDFLPILVRLMSEYKIFSKIDFTSELATLTLIDAETGKEVTYTTPMASAQLKAAHDIQNLGAAQTYLRRYLYTNAFDIVEHDLIDSSEPIKPAKQVSKPMNQKKVVEASTDEIKAVFIPMTLNQKKDVAGEFRRLNNDPAIIATIKKEFGESSTWSKDKADEVIEYLRNYEEVGA